MKLRNFIWRVLSIAYLAIVLATSNSIWAGSVVGANPAEISSRVDLNLRQISQPLNGKNLQKSLDRNDAVDVVRQVELGWQYQYEAYYEGKLKSRYLELSEIQRQLAKIDQSTKTRSALLYEVPRPGGLHLIRSGLARW